MSRLLQTVQLTRPRLPTRIAIPRPAAMIRGYPARSEMNEDDPKVHIYHHSPLVLITGS